jgi:hypothetical protein
MGNGGGVDPAVAMSPPFRERLVLVAMGALFLHLVLFRQGTFVYQFHKASSGAWLDDAARVLDGEALYRDFADEAGPGVVHLDAAVMAVFGRRLTAMAWTGLALGAALGLALHALAARTAPAPWRFLPPALAMVLVYPAFDLGHPRWPALLLGVLALLPLARTPEARGAFAAGLLLGGAGVFDLEIALPLILGSLLHVAVSGGRGRARAALALALGATLPLLVAFGALAARAGAGAVVDGWLGPIASRMAGAGAAAPARWGLRQAAFLATALGGLGAGAIVLARGRRLAADVDEARRLRAIALPGVCLVLSGLAGPWHDSALAVRALPLTPCLAWGLLRALDRGPAVRWAGRGVFALLALGLLHSLLGLVVLRQWLQPLVWQRFRAGAAWIGAPNAELRWLEDRTRPGDHVFVFPAGGAAYFLTGTRNATPFPYAIEGRFDRNRQREALAHIAAVAPRVGIWMGGQRIAPPPGADDLGTLHDGILGSYRPVHTLPNGTLLLERVRP